MALGIFNSRFSVNSSVQSGSNFIVNAGILDGTGLFTGFDVQNGDLVFLDISNAPVDNAFVARYRIVTVLNTYVDNVDVELQYLDGGTTPDPNDYSNVPGFICRPSPLMKLAWVSAAGLQGLSDYLITYAFDITLLEQIDIISNHANLSNLDYDNSGHTGFQKALIWDEALKAYIVP